MITFPIYTFINLYLLFMPIYNHYKYINYKIQYTFTVIENYIKCIKSNFIIIYIYNYTHNYFVFRHLYINNKCIINFIIYAFIIRSRHKVNIIINVQI